MVSGGGPLEAVGHARNDISVCLVAVDAQLKCVSMAHVARDDFCNHSNINSRIDLNWELNACMFATSLGFSVLQPLTL